MNTKKKFFVALLLMLIMSIANADIVVIVSKRSTVNNLDKNQVSDLFLGKISVYQNGNIAVPIDQIEGDIKEKFYDKVTNKSKTQVKSYWAKMVFSGKGNPPKEVSNNVDVVKLISDNPDLIGYVEEKFLNPNVKVVYQVKDE